MQLTFLKLNLPLMNFEKLQKSGRSRETQSSVGMSGRGKWGCDQDKRSTVVNVSTLLLYLGIFQVPLVAFFFRNN